jgi:hypothetical protein
MFVNMKFADTRPYADPEKATDTDRLTPSEIASLREQSRRALATAVARRSATPRAEGGEP